MSKDPKTPEGLEEVEVTEVVPELNPEWFTEEGWEDEEEDEHEG